MGVGSDDECSDETRAGPGGRRRRWVLGGAVGLILLAVVGWVMMNVILNLSWTKQKIGKKAVQLVGAPLEVGRILVTPWGTVRLIDIQMVIPEAAKIREDFPPIVSCGEIRIALEPLSVLTRDIRVTSVEIVDPVLSVVRSRGGGLILPGRKDDKIAKVDDRKSDPESLGTATLSPNPPAQFVMTGEAVEDDISSENLLAEASAEEGMQAEEAPEGAVPKGEVLKGEDSQGKVSKEETPAEQGTIDDRGESAERSKDKVTPSKEAGNPIVIRFRDRDFHLGTMILRRGRLQVSSLEDEKVLMEIDDLEMVVNLGADVLRPGSITAARITFFDSIEATALRGEVVSNGLWMDFLNVSADVEGGRVEGKVKASPFFRGVPFIAVIEAKDVPVRGIASLVAPAVAMEGVNLNGELKVLGLLRDPSSYRGRGEIKLEGALLGRSELLEPFSKVVNVAALEDVPVNDIYVKFGVGGRNLSIDDFRASSQDITLAGRGFVGTQGWLLVAIRLYLSERAYSGVRAVERCLPEGRSLGFIPYEGSAERFYRDYMITGTPEVPLINFWALDEAVPVAGLKERLFQLLGSASENHLPGSAD